MLRQSQTEYKIAKSNFLQLDPLGMGFRAETIGHSLIVHADCFEWLKNVPENTLHAIVTDPPYGVKEYEPEQITKRKNGHGGVWRIPPSFDGSIRAPLPRFTALNDKERAILSQVFHEWGALALKALRPGGHILIASNAFLSQLVFSALVASGLEFRGEIIRLVRTFRGGDRPKNAEDEFPEVSSLPRSCYEPWGIFRKPLPRNMTVSHCLRKYGTGGLRRPNREQPFADVIPSERTPQIERDIADHPSLKPQSFMRQLIHAVLPLGVGVIADPFMGSGSTVAAAEAMQLQCIGVERHLEYYELAKRAIPQLARLTVSRTVESEAEQLTLQL
jgi:site-specific DNA-methyltransferase (adenine-specific)